MSQKTTSLVRGGVPSSGSLVVTATWPLTTKRPIPFTSELGIELTILSLFGLLMSTTVMPCAFASCTNKYRLPFTSCICISIAGALLKDIIDTILIAVDACALLLSLATKVNEEQISEKDAITRVSLATLN